MDELDEFETRDLYEQREVEMSQGLQDLFEEMKKLEKLQAETLNNLKELRDILLIPAEVELKKGDRNGRER